MEIDPAYSNSNMKIWRRLDSDEPVYAPGLPSMEMENKEQNAMFSENGCNFNVRRNYCFYKDCFYAGHDALPEFGPKKFDAKTLFPSKFDKLTICDQSRTFRKEHQLGKEVETRDVSEKMETDSAEQMEEEKTSKKESGATVHDVPMDSPEISGKNNKYNLRKRSRKQKPKEKVRKRPRERQEKIKTSLYRNPRSKKNNGSRTALILSRPARDSKNKDN